MATNNAVNNDLSNPIIRTGTKDSNGNVMFTFSPSASAVNYFAFQNTATGGAPTFFVQGSDSNISLNLNTAGTGGVVLKGTGTNDSAGAGYVGEFKDSGLSALSNFTTTNTVQNLQTLSLTAGDWDVRGLFIFSISGATATATIGSLSLTSAINSPINSTSQFNFTAAALGNVSAYPVARFSIATTSTIYLVGQATFTVGNPQFLAGITARRVR